MSVFKTVRLVPFLLIALFLLSPHAVFAIGLTPPSVALSTVTSTKTGHVTIVRGASDVGVLTMDVSAHGAGSEFFSGDSTFILAADATEGTYAFQITPSSSANGNYSLQVDFLVRKNPADSGSTVITGATAIVTFSAVGHVSSNGSSGGSVGGLNPVLPSTPILPVSPVVVPPVKPKPSVLVPTVPVASPVIPPTKSSPQNPPVTKPSTSIAPSTNPPTLIPVVTEFPTESFSTGSPNLSLSNDTTIPTFAYSITQSPNADFSSLTSTSDVAVVNVNLPDGIYFLHVADKNNPVKGITTKKIVIDTTPPDILNVTAQTQSVFLGSNIFLSISASDKTTSVAYFTISTPNGIVKSVSSTIALHRLSLGKHLYQMQAVDELGNTQTVFVAVTVDKESFLETLARLWRAFFHV